MKRAILTLLVLALASLTLHAKSGNIDGTWLPMTAELGGKPFPEDIRKSIRLVVTRWEYTVTVGLAVDKGSLKLNTTTKPKQMDILGSEGPNKGKRIPAIYERKGDTLTICYDLSGTAYPTKFESVEGTQLYLVTYHRQKP